LEIHTGFIFDISEPIGKAKVKSFAAMIKVYVTVFMHHAAVELIYLVYIVRKRSGQNVVLDM